MGRLATAMDFDVGLFDWDGSNNHRSLAYTFIISILQSFGLLIQLPNAKLNNHFHPQKVVEIYVNSRA